MTVRVNLEDHVRLFDFADRWQITPDRFLHVSRGETLVASFNVWTSVELLEDEKLEEVKINFDTNRPGFKGPDFADLDFKQVFDKLDTLSKYGRKFLE